jgi:hypothetical protein
MNKQEIKELLVTPQLASEFLKMNVNNRTLSEKKAAYYAAQMKKGLWKRNTFEFIKIAENGVILDGQHRLAGVIIAGVPVYFHIVYNVNEDVFDVLDTGMSRSATDIFNIANIKNACSVPSIMKLYLDLSNQCFNKRAKQYSNAELLLIHENDIEFYDDITRLAINVYKTYNRLITTQQIGGIAGCIAKKYSINTANEFFTDLSRGNNERTNAGYLLTQKLMKSKLSKYHKLNYEIVIPLVLKTFNFWINRKNVKILKFDPEVEKFPYL